MTRQTLRDFLSSIGSTATSITIPVDPGSNGVVDTGDDLGVEPNIHRELLDTRTGDALLGDYLSFVTKKNEYPLSPGAHESVSPKRGHALSTAETTSAPDVFADSRLSTNAESLNRSNSLQFDASGNPLNTIVDKIGDGSATSGNSLLSDTIAAAASSDTAPDQTRAVKASFASLKHYNYFSPTSSPSSFAKSDSGNSIDSDEFESTRYTRFQKGKGDYSVEITEIAAELRQDELANIARSMILRSAGWDSSTAPRDAKNPETAFDAVSSDTLSRFPEIVRDNIGTVDAFRARDSYGFPENPDGSSFLEGRGTVLDKNYEEANYTKTRGSLNTPDQPFGESPTSDNRIQSLQAGLSIIGLATLIDKKLINMSQIVKDLKVEKDDVLRGPYFLGRSAKSDLDAKTRALVRSFMFETGIYGYEKCVAEGLYSCFGYNPESDRQDTLTDDISVSSISNLYGPLVKKIAADLDKPFFDSPMGLSQGFWRSVSESAIRSIRNIRRSAQKNDGVDYIRCLLEMKDSLAVKIMNVFASIGYQRLVIQSISTPEVESGGKVQNPFGIDDYPNAPGTRQMKSRDGEILSKASLAWRNSALPSAFLLPVEAMMSALVSDYMFDTTKGSNPIKGMLGSTLYDKTYVKAVRNAGGIPPAVAKSIEDRLGAEYVPFYFRDLRTNEVIAFHAFLDTLSDAFTTSYSETKGFGRSEAVQNYTNTNRTISFTFHVVATSKEDFDEMWFKINKLTTLAYPQYTRGRNVSAQDTGTFRGAVEKSTINFEQPFSQLVGGTPVVRIRIGDLLKTNYSRSNFGRLFGVGNETFNGFSSSPDTISRIASAFDSVGAFLNNTTPFAFALMPFLAYAASPMEVMQFTTSIRKVGSLFGALKFGLDEISNIGSTLLVNGFVNPAIYDDRSSMLKNSNLSNLFENLQVPEAYGSFLNQDFLFGGLKRSLILKPRSTPYNVVKNGNTRYVRLLRPVFVSVESVASAQTGPTYSITIDDNTLPDEIRGSKCTVSAADLYVDTGKIVDITTMPGILLSAGVVSSFAGTISSNASKIASDALTNAISVPTDFPLANLLGSAGRSFIAPENNPITRAFEDRMGEGLAGVIKGLTMGWEPSVWETDWNSRAPKMCKITVSFTPIHDIAPGLDSNGFNRAPIYNVGQIMHDSFGNSREDGGTASQFYYKQGGAVAETATQPTWQQKQK